MNLTSAFAERFAARPRIFRAPGRINLIGEHTDYNGGFVMPAAIDLATWTAAAPRSDRRIAVVSRAVGEEIAFDLDDASLGPRGVWSDYVLGVARVLEQSGFRLRGAHLMIESTVPLGSGLSSSAALEVSVALALLGVAGLTADRLAVARMAQRAEHEYAGALCGLMDQFAASFGVPDHALLLDCRSLEFRAVPLPAGVSLIAANTMVKHELAAGEYNRRRTDCEEAARLLGVAALREADGGDRWTKRLAELPEPIRRRARHVVSENARTVEAAEALERGDLARMGRLMDASHASLRDDFEVSCPELDAMVAAAAPLEGVYGSRMMGGGFGGCTITLARAEAAVRIMRQMEERYASSTGIAPKLSICRATGGAGEEEAAAL